MGIGSEIEAFLLRILADIELLVQRTETENEQDDTLLEQLETCMVSVDNAASFLRHLMLSVEGSLSSEVDEIYQLFRSILRGLGDAVLEISPVRAVRRISNGGPGVLTNDLPGRPSFNLPCETLEELRGLGFTWSKIAQMLGVSRWTISRRVKQYGLESLQGFSDISDQDLDSLVKELLERQGRTMGQVFISGYLKSKGLWVQRRRVRDCLLRVDPDNRILRWGVVVSRRVYYVPWPNSVWHLDGHHSLIRWGLVIHGCINGFSRKVMFLKCSPNNYAETVLQLFTEAVDVSHGLWPSRIRVDRGVENVLVCDLMVAVRGHGRGSFIAGPSTRNQRIERLWRDVFRCVCHYFYYVFYAMEQSGILNMSNDLHLFVLHLVFLPRINFALEEYLKMFNDHKIRTAQNMTPNQLWTNGMLDPNNPLATDKLDEDPEDLEHFAEDVPGPTPFDDSDNNVIVEPINFQGAEAIAERVLQGIDPMMDSMQMGIDVFTRAIDIAEQHQDLVEHH